MNKSFSLIFVLMPFLAIGQKHHAVPINLSFFNEATAIPFTRILTTPVHPGIQVGTEFNYWVKPHTRLFQTANLNYFYHHRLNHGIGLYSELGYEHRVKAGFSISGLFGLGYLHTFATAEEYIFTEGQYVKKKDRGNARLFPSLSFDLGFYLKKEAPNSPKLFIRYQSWVEYPYSPGFIPLMTHTNLHLGAKFFLTK